MAFRHSVGACVASMNEQRAHVVGEGELAEARKPVRERNLRDRIYTLLGFHVKYVLGVSKETQCLQIVEDRGAQRLERAVILVPYLDLPGRINLRGKRALQAGGGKVLINELEVRYREGGVRETQRWRTQGIDTSCARASALAVSRACIKRTS